MRATELIAELRRQAEAHGDLPAAVAVPVAPGASVYVSSEDIDVGPDADGERIKIGS